jgi:uncharacterized MnhB-related membrane protein
MILKIIAIILALAIILMAIIAVQNKKLIVAIIAAGVVSLFASVFYLLLSAPDVAMTEAAIGSGLSTIIFFYVLNKIKKDRLDNV